MDVALVTGANSGIGCATAIRLAAGGYTVYGGMRDLASGTRLAERSAAEGVEVRPIRLDVTDEELVRSAVAQITEDAGGVDVLVNNAGITENGTVEETSAESFQRVFDVNVCGIVRCSAAVLPHMRERRRGTIVNIASIAGRVAMGAQAPYATSKWAVEGLTEGLAQEVRAHGIRVVLIEPGVTKTPIFAKATEVPASTGAYEASYRRMFQFFAAGLREATRPQEVGEVVYSALSADEPALRHVCSWGAAELAAGRRSMTDEEWVALGGLDSDDDYYREFSRLFGLDIAPGGLASDVSATSPASPENRRRAT
ncbi:SDR family oxidoreductase [Actinomadura sp. KC216]|uniref:SDR family oxidoreductase n=1 Tax=Actinomadura sp. KC216 TaxID=2530370 RepID=UPI00140468B2|nr:SDR family oxidoreductase [Actinomadura sp. KC216]